MKKNNWKLLFLGLVIFLLAAVIIESKKPRVEAAIKTVNLIKIEAENGELKGVKVVKNQGCSGGSYVEGFNTGSGNLKLNIDVLTKGTYLITVKYKTMGGDRPHDIYINNSKIATYTFKDTSVFKEAVIGQYDFNSGKNTFSITSNWGWIGVDYIELMGGNGGSIKNVTICTNVPDSQPYDLPVILTASADNASEFCFYSKKTGGNWEVLNNYSKSLNCVWKPPSEGEYELKVDARSIGSTVVKQAEKIIEFKALPAYINKPLVNQMFSDNMILQRNEEDAIWGWSEPGKKVEVTIGDKAYSGIVDSKGTWSIKVGPFSAGGPYSMTVTSSSQTVNMKNILFGDVWLCSGQSNMEFILSRTMDAANEIKKANNPNIHFFTVPSKTSALPLSSIENSKQWQACTPETASSITAVGYFYASKLNKELNVPIGIISSAVAGTKAQTWMSYEALSTFPDFIVPSQNIRTGLQNIEVATSPTALYNGMISPIVPFKLKGVLWYQGEWNSGEYGYNKLLPALIMDWRTKFAAKDLPFVVVQLSAYGKIQTKDNPVQTYPGFPEIREAQLMTMEKEKNVGLVVTTDLGNPLDIHPTNKQDVGRRAALCALGKFYGRDLVYSGPIYKSMKKEGDKIRITLDELGSGLMVGIKTELKPVQEDKRGILKGFAIAGSDNKFYYANAVFDGNTILVSSGKVKEPVSVRYGWNDSPIGNLYNKEGLAASPFRTDYLSLNNLW